MARLKVGEKAPDFQVTDMNQKSISLVDFSGHYTLLSFMRYAGCPFCDMTLIKLVERYQNFSARGLEVVTFFQSPADTIEAYVLQRQPPFSLVADPDRAVYDLYRIESSKVGLVTTLPAAVGVGAALLTGKTKQGKITGDGFLMPAQFVIGPDLTLQNVHYGTNYGDKIPFIEIETLLLTHAMEEHDTAQS